ncbi:MAG: methyltransferase domain-containing protein [Thermoplasmata archaeon]|nr:methyltransferase domain-containing protein [Thermoplasmata archaeon]
MSGRQPGPSGGRLPGLSPNDTFDRAYEGTPPWDIGRPQPEVVRLADDGEFSGTVLDLGCGTGENALELARRGLTVWGVDSSPNALRRARTKGAERGLSVTFRRADALHLETLETTFDAVLDCGLFHVFDDAARADYVASLGRAVRVGGRYFLLVFSDAEPTDWGGPRRISEREILSAFHSGWKVDFLRAARFATNMPEVRGHAWCGRLTRTRA